MIATISMRALVFAASVGATAAHAQIWESALRGMSPEAVTRIRHLCKTEARQDIFATVEGVNVLYWKTEEGNVAAHAELHGELGGINSSSPENQFLRLGLQAVEFLSTEATAAMFQKMDTAQPFARFDTRQQKLSYADKLTADVEIAYLEHITPEDRALGIHGRTLRVTDLRTSKLLAERTEFFWLAGRVRWERALCPSIGPYERSPASFIGKVVNPASYTCASEYETARSLHPDRHAIRVFNMLIKKVIECDAAYYSKR